MARKKKKPQPRKKQSAAVIESLEARTLFSADIFGGALDGPANDDGYDATINDALENWDFTEGESPQTSTSDSSKSSDSQSEEPAAPLPDTSSDEKSHELVVVDTATPDYQQFIDDILAQSGDSRQIEVVLLDSERDGLEQLSSLLASYSDLDALHIISHGDAGEIALGNNSIDLADLQSQSEQFALWSNAFSESGDLLIYGCDLASTVEGELFVNYLAQLTETDIAASDDLTGNAEQGGDWQLEYSTGDIETELAVSAGLQENYEEVLANTAPVLSGANDFTAIDEDNTTSSGTLVSDLISGQVSDVDGGDPEGIAIIATDTSNGTWEYTTNGSTWNSVGAVDQYNALLLAADGDNALRFVPTGGYDGTVTNGITFHAWDQSVGTDGTTTSVLKTEILRDEFSTQAYTNSDGTVDWSANPWVEVSDDNSPTSGGFLVESNQLRLDARSTSDYIYRQADLTGATSATLSFDYNNQLHNFALGDKRIELQVSGNGGSNWTTLYTFHEDNKGSASQEYDISSYTASNTQVRFKVSDSKSSSDDLYIDNFQIAYDVAGTGGDTEFSSASFSSSITVYPLTAPTLAGANNLSNIDEDDTSNSGTLVSSLISGQVSDSFADALEGIAITAVDNTNGTWQYTTDGSSWSAINATSPATTLLLASDGNNAVRFVPDADWNGTVTDGITFYAWDQTSGTDGGTVDLYTTMTVRDNFNTVSYSNNDGTAAQGWSSDWTESDSGGGSATSGKAFIHSTDNELYLFADGSIGDSIYRDIDLSQATSATLKIEWENHIRTAGGDSCRVVLEVSENGVDSWRQLDYWEDGYQDNGNTMTASSYALLAEELTADTQIRFSVTGLDADENMRFNYVEVEFAAPGTGGSTAYSALSASSNISVNAVNDAAVLDLDADNSSGGSGVDYQGNFTEGGAAVSITDSDVSVSDVDDTNIESATITLTNAQTDDVLAAGSLPAGITASSYNSGTGVISLSGSATLADYETAIEAITFNNTSEAPDTTDRVITVMVNDGDDNSATATSTISVTAVDAGDVGAVSDNDGSVNTIAENATANTTVGISALATDTDAHDDVTYSLSDDADGLFKINASTGIVSLVVDASLDAETATSHDITVLATSDDGSTSSAVMTINVTDVDEVDMGAVSDNDGTANSIAENATANTPVGITALATDADVDDSTTYSLSDDAGGLFKINASTGVVSLVTSGSLDAETATSHNITVLATSDDGSTSSAVMTINVTDIDEVDIGAVSDNDGTANTIAENATANTTVGITALASDADVDDSTTYSLSDDAGGLFKINASTGVVSLVTSGSLDAETATSHNITVLATSDDTSTSNQTFSITVTDVNEAPAQLSLSTTTVDENTDTLGGHTVGALSTSDVDAGDSATYSIQGGADAVVFSIGGVNSNELILSDGTLDFETQSSYTVIVRVTDSGGLTHDESLVVTVNDINDTPKPAVERSAVYTNEGGSESETSTETLNTKLLVSDLAVDGTERAADKASSDEDDKEKLEAVQKNSEQKETEHEGPLSVGLTTEAGSKINQGDESQAQTHRSSFQRAEAGSDPANGFKFIDLKHIDFAQLAGENLGYTELLEMNFINNHPALSDALFQMSKDLDEAANDFQHREQQNSEVSVGVSISLTAGVVSWLLRGGSLLASFMSVSPLWAQIDPLPVLAAVNEEEEVEGIEGENDQDDSSKNSRVEKFFDEDE